jgi:hypothetical protein
MHSPSSAVNAIGAVDTSACIQGAQACAVSKVSDDDSLSCKLRQLMRQNGSDIFIGQTVEAVPKDIRFTDIAWKRDHFRDRRVTAMKAGVKAGNLRNVRQTIEDCFNRRQIMRLMQWSERNQLIQVLEDLTVHNGRPNKTRSTMHDTMADSEHPRTAVPGPQPYRQYTYGCGAVADGFTQLLVREYDAGRRL